jgi:dipeptidyl aminopeptidase/acylaminoacyl peptidase
LQQTKVDNLPRAYRNFHEAYAGLANCRYALEFAIQSVEEVDPERIYIAGHSSAGALALLCAAHEPRIRGCIAYAPETDVEAFVGEFRHQLPASEFPGLAEFARRSSPRTHMGRIDCPVFLFHSTTDSVVPFARSQAFCNELQQLGKNVTFVRADRGDHYNAMLTTGIPHALDWIRQQANHSPPP